MKKKQGEQEEGNELEKRVFDYCRIKRQSPRSLKPLHFLSLKNFLIEYTNIAGQPLNVKCCFYIRRGIIISFFSSILCISLFIVAACCSFASLFNNLTQLSK